MTRNQLPAISLLSMFILLTILTTKAQTQHHPSDSSIFLNYVDFLKNQDQSPTDYILSLFETNDIVILCERVHPETTQYDMILNLVSNPGFIDKVGHIYTEVGVSSVSDQLESYLTDKDLSENQSQEQLQDLYRNLTFHPVWDKTNYYNFLQDIRKLNMELEANKQIHIYPSDIPFNWQEMTEEKYPSFRTSLLDRDKHMADQIGLVFDSIAQSNSSRNKALVIMNYRHAFPHITFSIGDRSRQISNVGGYILEAYPGRVANVLINSIRILPGSTDNMVQFTAVGDGIWDAAFEVLGNPDVGFSFLDSPFGLDSFDFFPVETDYIYQDIFTGMVFYKPIEQHIMSAGIPEVFDDQFMNEVIRRQQVSGDKRNEEEMISDYLQLKEIEEFGYENKELFGVSDYKLKIKKWVGQQIPSSGHQ